MRKKKPYGETAKERYAASTRDRLYNFLLADGAFRGVILHATRMINEMRANHELGILETLVLGRAYIGAGLMSANLKGNDRLQIKIDCSGPIEGLTVETNAFGEVRGYLKRVPIPLEAPMTDFDLAPFFGSGILSVTRHLEDAKHPFTGQVHLKYGNIAQDLAYYFLTSEQVPTAFNLSIKFDRRGEVTGAGGVMLQAMPAAGDKEAAELEERMLRLPSLGEEFSADQDPKQLVERAFAAWAPRFLAERHVEFMCHCGKERIRTMLGMLSREELASIRDSGPFPLEIRCHYCNTAHMFSRQEIARIYAERYADA